MATVHCITCTVLSRVSTHGCLGLMGQKLGVGAYKEKPHGEPHQILGSSKTGVGVYMEMDICPRRI